MTAEKKMEILKILEADRTFEKFKEKFYVLKFFKK